MICLQIWQRGLLQGKLPVLELYDVGDLELVSNLWRLGGWRMAMMGGSLKRSVRLGSFNWEVNSFLKVGENFLISG